MGSNTTASDQYAVFEPRVEDEWFHHLSSWVRFLRSDNLVLFLPTLPLRWILNRKEKVRMTTTLAKSQTPLARVALFSQSYCPGCAKWLWLLAKLSIACGMIWFLIHQGTLDFRLFLEGTVSLNIVVVGLGCNLALISLGALRWHLLLGSQGIILPFSWTHRMIYLTMCFNLMVPGSVGGDALRMGYMARKTPATQKGAAILSIFLDRFTGLYSLFVIAFLALFLNLDTVLTILPMRVLALSLAIVVGGGPLAVLLLFWGGKYIPMIQKRASIPSGSNWSAPSWISTVINQMVNSAHLFCKAKGRLAAALAVSVLAQVIEILALLWIAKGLNMLTFPADHFFVAAPLAWVANVLPISPGGLGVGEAAFAQICQWLQPTSATIAFGTIFLVNRILQMLASLPGLWVYLVYRQDASMTHDTPPK